MTSLHITILLFSMIFCHILDDYVLQGQLASLKQKKWWKENYPDELYKNDWIIALCTHAFSWTFMIHVPIFVFLLYFGSNINVLIVVASFVLNLAIHATVDHLKANKFKLNLTQDQLIHLTQIAITWLIFCTVR